jgi:hypothetical protein
LGAPGARCSTGSSHAIANMLGTRVQLNGDGLDAAHGLVTLAAARVMHRGRFVVIKKSRLAAAADATWTRKHGSSTWLGWHLGLKYGLGVQDGFMLETASGWVKEEGEAGEYLYSHQYLKTWILSPSGLRSRGAWRRRPPPQTYNEGYLQRPLVRCWKVYI